MVKLVKIIIHLFFWVVFVAISGTMSYEMERQSWVGESPVNHIGVLLIGLVWAMAAFYSFYFFMYRFVEKHRFVRYLLLSLLLSTVISVVFIVICRLFIFPGKYNVPQMWNYTTILGTYVIASCGCLLRGFVAWIDSVQVKSDLEKRAITAELEALRSQVNPHFLFNTLNNIDALIAKEPQKASNAIIALSDIMRYMLDETSHSAVDLSREVQHVRNIISLQELRFRHSGSVLVEINGDVRHHQIAPLMFVPFIENAFKYAHYSGQLPVVSVRFDVADDVIQFTCINHYNPDAKVALSNGGIGLSNLKKQLMVLYPGKHTLRTESKNGIFEAVLSIDMRHE